MQSPVGIRTFGGPYACVVDWFDELPLDPATHPVSMGTHALGARPWFVVDASRDIELAEKRLALVERRDEVAWFTEEAVEPANSVCRLIEDAGIAVPRGAAHPIEDAALAVQDDLCLLRRIDGVWHFDASVVCFPTHWHLPSKVGRPLTDVHDPVGGYHERIAAKVTRLFDRVSEKPVLRRNFGLTGDRGLFQPAYRTADPHIAADRVMTDLLVRSERQTLRRIADDWLLFCIRIQMASLGELLTTPERTARFRHWVSEVPPEIAPKRHLGEAQRAVLLNVLPTA